MPIRQKGLLDYIPAAIHPGKDFHVSYYVVNPDTNQLERKKVRLNRIKKVSDRNATARRLVHTINMKLAKGWNPFIENEAPKSLHKLTDVLNTYQTVKFRETEAHTIRSYTSFLKMITDYITGVLKDPDMFVYKFDRVKASDMMLWIYTNRAKTGKTYNNYLFFFKSLFNWMKEFNYVRVNPFENMRPKAEKEKFRKPVDDEMRNRIREYLYGNNKNYLAICLLCYHCFMRPKEICELKVSDICHVLNTVDIQNQEKYVKK
jgi:integrase